MKKLKVRVANLLKATQLVNFQLCIRGFCPFSPCQPAVLRLHSLLGGRSTLQNVVFIPSLCKGPWFASLRPLLPGSVYIIRNPRLQSYPVFPWLLLGFALIIKMSIVERLESVERIKKLGKKPHMTLLPRGNSVNALVSLLPIFSIIKQG